MNEEVNAAQLHEGIWKIEKYGTLEGNGWNEVKDKMANMYLILKNMSVMLTRNNTLIEHVSLLTSDVRMVLKADCLGIAIKHENAKMKKIRVKFSSTNLYSGEVVGKNCAAILKKYAKIEDLSIDCGIKGDLTADTPTLVSLPEHILQLLKKNTMKLTENNNELTKRYPLEEIMEICILDVNFPSFVTEIHDLLSAKLK